MRRRAAESAATRSWHFFLEEAAAGAPARPAAPPPAPGRPGQPQTGRIERVEAYGNVEVRTMTEVVRGERAVYSPVTSLARVLGNVRITRAEINSMAMRPS